MGFCKLAAEIQNRLAISSYLTSGDIDVFDKNLVAWFESLPRPLRSPNHCARTLLVPRAILRWRYQNIRLLLYRPALLHAGLSRKPFAELSPVEKVAVQSCRSIAGDSIIDITTDWQPDHICGWNAVWYHEPILHVLDVLLNLSPGSCFRLQWCHSYRCSTKMKM